MFEIESRPYEKISSLNIIEVVWCNVNSHLLKQNLGFEHTLELGSKNGLLVTGEGPPGGLAVVVRDGPGGCEQDVLL